MPMATRDATPVTQLYQKLEVVGKGSYGSVYKGIQIATGKVVALKIINLDTEDDDVADIQREVTLLSQLRGAEHNNVTIYYGCYLEGPKVWIVMDFASGGSVRTLMKATKNNIIEERFTVLIVRETITALAFVHKSGVIHRDIKAANILVTHTGRVVLCDFGVSALLSTTHSKRTTFVGTPHWMAPEVITSGSLYDSKADIWSLGVTIYEMITGGPPHGDQLNMRAIALIPKSKPPRLPEASGSKEMKEFVANCLKELPAERPSAEELSKAKWIKASAKTPVSVLRDLLKIYDAWADTGGVRASLAGDDMPWEDEHEDEVDSDANDWEFDTFRGPRPDPNQQDYDSFDEYLEQSSTSLLQSPNASAATALQPPRSLRHLFGEDNAAQLHPPLDFTPSSLPRASSPYGNSPSHGALDIPSRGDAIDTPTPKQSSWSAPQRPPPSTPLSRAPSPTPPPPPPEAKTPPGSPTSPKTSNYRDVRDSKGLANISIPPLSSSIMSGDDHDYGRQLSSSPESDAGHLDHSPTLRLPPTNILSQISSSSGAGPSTPPRPTRQLPSPSEQRFAFPSAATPSPSTARAAGEFPEGVGFSPARHLATPAAHPGLTRTTSTSPYTGESSHTHSPGNGHGKYSASPLSRKPTLVRQASVAVMETHGMSSSAAGANGNGHASPYSFGGADRTIKPERNAAKGYRSEPENGHGASSTLTIPRAVPTVGLKDVLNLSLLPVDPNSGAGPGDLLPPSPSATALAESGSMTMTIKKSPSILTLSDLTMQSGSSFTTSTTTVDVTSPTLNLNVGPSIRPLDYSFMLSSDDLQMELARTVDDLTQWLSAVDAGLTGVLDMADDSYGGKYDEVVIPEDNAEFELIPPLDPKDQAASEPG